MKNKVITIILGILIVLLFIILIVINLQTKSNTKIITLDKNKEYTTNVRENVTKEQKVDGLTFKDINLAYQKKYGSILEVNVINDTENIYYLNGISAIVKDKDGKKIETLTSDNYIELSKGEKILYVLKTNKDLSSSAYSVEYKLAYQE